jgi:O-antigen ligase
MRISLKPTEIANVCLLLWFGNLGFIPILMPNTGGAASGHGQTDQVHGLNHVLLLAIWLGILYLLFRSRFRLRLDLFACKVAFFYSAVAVLGALFTKDPVGAMSGAVAVTLSTLYAIHLVSKYPVERLVVILGWMMLLLGVANVLFALGLPAYGLDHFTHGGSWQGVTAQKNTLGFVMTLGVGVGLCAKPASVVGVLWKRSIFLLSLAEVGLSRSREAWLICALLLTVHFLIKVLSRFRSKSRGLILVFTLVALFPVVSFLAANWTEILTSLGRDATLTGRVPLWGAVIEQSKLHPWVGLHGEGFWGSPRAEPVYAIIHWQPTSSHNGFLECLLEMGIAGLLPLVLLFLISFRGIFRVLTSETDFEPSRLWTYCVFVIFSFNLIQTTTGQPNSVGWLLLVGSACMLDANSRFRVPASIYAYRRNSEMKLGALIRL